jgi:hypothetical protein
MIIHRLSNKKGKTMYSCFKSFVQNGRESGLMLLNMPTGFGKTHSVLKFITDFMENEQNADKKLFFITTLKKNLPVDDLKKQLQIKCQEQLEEYMVKRYKDKVIKLESMIETVTATYSREKVYNAIPQKIRESKACLEFITDIEGLQTSQKNHNSDAEKKYRDSLADDRTGNGTERKFRLYIQELLFKTFPNAKSRLSAIKTQKDWQWVAELYPSVLTSEKQVIFMSVDKFLYPHSTLIEKPYTFYTSPITQGALVFIDEFDATKTDILDYIIKEGLRTRIDYIDLFKRIHTALHYNVFPKAIYKPSKQRMKNKQFKHSLKEEMNILKKMSAEIYSKYSLELFLKTDSQETDRNFMFRDNLYLNILSGNNAYISISADKKENINNISFSPTKPNNHNNIHYLLGEIQHFLNWFLTAVFNFSWNYFQCCSERQDSQHEYTFDEALHSILKPFNLLIHEKEFLIPQVMMKLTKTKPRSNFRPSDYDLSFYKDGFVYYSLDNSYEHELETIISRCSFSQPPENILATLCERAKVIGVSATATLPSVTSNYDLSYLSLRLGDSYVTPAQEDEERIRAEFQEYEKGYDDISIHTELLDSSNYSEAIWGKVFDDKELANEAYNCVARSVIDNQSNNDRVFHQERYFRIALAFKRFTEHSDIRSFLCLLNLFPKHNHPDLDIDTLYKLFGRIANKSLEDVKSMVVLMKSENFDSQKKMLLERLSNGEKIFVMSSYQTVGAGQNLQYSIPSELVGSLIKINDRPKSNQKDFDAIYVDKPTHLITNAFALGANAEKREESLVRFLFETEFLHQNGEISLDDKRQKIKEAFKAAYMGFHPHSQSLSHTPSVCLAVTRLIIQAIGRLCRTNMKQKNIYIFADAQICDYFYTGVADDILLNRETAALIDEIKKHASAKLEYNADIIERAETRANNVSAFIVKMVQTDWNETNMRQWSGLRSLSLASPTADNTLFMKDFRVNQQYIFTDKLTDRYYYQQEGDYAKMNISLTPSKDFPYEVSARSAKLDRILLFNGMREYFSDNGFATEFAPNAYHMTPAQFNNIYKGALGEVAGKFWFEKVLNIGLEDIADPSLFEQFDYQVPDLPVFVDFKNWHESSFFDEQKQIDKVIGKAKKCKAECVIVANILDDNRHDIIISTIDGIKLVRVPSLMLDNGSSVDTNVDAARKIGRCINEIRNHYE